MLATTSMRCGGGRNVRTASATARGSMSQAAAMAVAAATLATLWRPRMGIWSSEVTGASRPPAPPEDRLAEDEGAIGAVVGLDAEEKGPPGGLWPQLAARPGRRR